MSLSPHPRPARPFLRQAAFFTIGLGCLLIAGTVLSSIVQTPPAHEAQTYTNPAFAAQPVYAQLVSPSANTTDPPLLVALVRFHQGAIQITNNSYYPWHNLRVLNGDTLSPEAHSPACPVILPHQTYDVPLERVALAPLSKGYCHQAFSLCWECRTDHGSGEWHACLVR